MVVKLGFAPHPQRVIDIYYSVQNSSHRVMYIHDFQITIKVAFISEPSAFVDNPFTLLPCSCYERSSGRNAVDLGPMW